MSVTVRSLFRCRQSSWPIQTVVGRWSSSHVAAASSSKSFRDTSSSTSSSSSNPVDTSILQYIESIGIGIPPKQSTKRRRKRRKTNAPRNSPFLSRQEEQEELRPIRRMATKIPPPPFFIGEQRKKHVDDDDDDEDTIATITKRLPVKLIGSAASKEEFPRGSKGLAEVAIAGRSNVGKSTLLNALLYGNWTSPAESATNDAPVRKRPTGRTAKLPKGLKAITSSKPGETRVLNFYQLSSLCSLPSGKKKQQTTKISLLLVDLPGYGFAYATQDKIEGWKQAMQDYILHRGKPLKRILLLIDARHGMKAADFEFMESLQTALYQNTPEEESDEPAKNSSSVNNNIKKKRKRELPPIQLVLTKCDLVRQVDLARRVVQVRQQLSSSLLRQPSALPVMMVSAQMEGQAGVLELQKELASLVPAAITATTTTATTTTPTETTARTAKSK